MTLTDCGVLNNGASDFSAELAWVAAYFFWFESAYNEIVGKIFEDVATSDCVISSAQALVDKPVKRTI